MTESVAFGITFNPQHLEKETVIPCIPANGFRSMTGPINPWTLCGLLNEGRKHSVVNNFCHGVELLNEGTTIKTVSSHFVFEPRQLADINKLTYFPYKVVNRLCQVSPSSLLTVQILYNMTDGKTIVKCISDNMLEGVQSGKRKTLPWWFTDNYKHFTGILIDNIFAKKVKAGSTPLPEVPSSPPPFWLPLTVVDNESRLNKSVCKDSFIRFTFECLDQACSRNYFPYLGENLCDLDVSELSVRYYGDAFSGEKLNMFCWQSESPAMLWCVVKRNKTVLFSSKVVFDLGGEHIPKLNQGLET